MFCHGIIKFPQIVLKSTVVLIDRRTHIASDSLTVIVDEDCSQSGGVLISKHQKYEGTLYSYKKFYLIYKVSYLSESQSTVT